MVVVIRMIELLNGKVVEFLLLINLLNKILRSETFQNSNSFTADLLVTKSQIVS